MKTEKKLCIALKSMMSEQPLESISVLSLTNRCHIYRQTFYYHFHDIYDLLSLVYIEERIEKINEVNSLNEMLEKIYNYYSSNTKFVDATINSAGKELFKEFLFNNCNQAILCLLDKIDETKIISAAGRKSIARFYASAYANSILYAIEIKKVRNLKQLMSETSFIDDENLSISVKKLLMKELIKK